MKHVASRTENGKPIFVEANMPVEFLFSHSQFVFSLACRYVKVHVYCRVHYVGIFVVYARCTVQTGILIFVIYHKKREEIFIQVKPQICADGVCMCANMLNTVEQKKNPPVKKANCNKKLTENGRERKVF